MYLSFFKPYIIPMRLLLFYLVFGYTSALFSQNALHFDGSNDAMNCGTDTAFNVGGSAFTIEAWVYAESWNTNIYEGTIVLKENNSNNGGWMLRAGSGGKLGCAIGAGTSSSWYEINTSSSVMSLYTWYHVATTYDGSKLKLFLNGQVLDSLSVSISVGKSTSTPLSVGYHPAYGRYWNGIIDEIRVWGRTLSASELYSNMNQEFCSRQASDLRAYYKFSQGTANANNSTQTSVIDYSLFQNNATLSGFALTGSSSNYVNGASLQTDSSYSYDTLERCGAFYDPGTKTFYSKTGNYSYHFASHMGCDSFLQRRVIIKSNSTYTLEVAACDSFVGPLNKVYRKSGTYTAIIPNAVGCDSVITIRLKIGSDTTFIDTTVCEIFTSFTGKNYSISGLYYDTLSSYIGCDSILCIKLNVNYNKAGAFTDYVCDSVQSPSQRHWYYSPGFYSDTIASSLGCDSVISIILISAKTSHSITESSCDSYLSNAGNTYTTTGQYIEHFTNVLGCDSLLTIDLTILQTTSSTVNLNACDSIRSVNQQRVFTSSGTYLDTLINAVGCDSVVTQIVVITTIDASIVITDDYTLKAQLNGASYRWLDCDDNYSPISGATAQTFQTQLRGLFAVEVSKNGCLDTSDCVTIAGLTVDGIENQLGLIIYPNPSEHGFSVSSEFNLHHIEVEIFNVLGMKVYENHLLQSKSIDIRLDVEPGTYILRLNSDEGQSVKKLIIR